MRPGEMRQDAFFIDSTRPIAFFNFDIGTEGVVGKFIDDKEIYISNYDPGSEDPESEWERFESDYRSIMRVPEIRTFIIDTATEAWELLRISEFGKLDQVMPHLYGPVNATYRRMIRDGYDCGKNIILIHKMKAEYVNNDRTGNYVQAGFADTPFLTQVNLQMFRDYNSETERTEFSALIRDCRQTPEINNEVLEGPLCTFPTLALMVLPDSDEEDWY